MYFAQLALYSLLAWFVLGKVLQVAPFWWGAGVVISALTFAGNIFALAQRSGAHAEHVSAEIVTSMVTRVVTASFAAWLVLE